MHELPQSHFGDNWAGRNLCKEKRNIAFYKSESLCDFKVYLEQIKLRQVSNLHIHHAYNMCFIA